MDKMDHTRYDKREKASNSQLSFGDWPRSPLQLI